MVYILLEAAKKKTRHMLTRLELKPSTPSHIFVTFMLPHISATAKTNTIIGGRVKLKPSTGNIKGVLLKYINTYAPRQAIKRSISPFLSSPQGFLELSSR